MASCELKEDPTQRSLLGFHNVFFFPDRRQAKIPQQEAGRIPLGKRQQSYRTVPILQVNIWNRTVKGGPSKVVLQMYRKNFFFAMKFPIYIFYITQNGKLPLARLG